MPENGSSLSTADARTARSTDVSSAASMPGRTRTTAPATSTSVAGDVGAGAGAASGSAGSTRSGTKPGSAKEAAGTPAGSGSKPLAMIYV